MDFRNVIIRSGDEVYIKFGGQGEKKQRGNFNDLFSVNVKGKTSNQVNSSKVSSKLTLHDGSPVCKMIFSTQEAFNKWNKTSLKAWQTKYGFKIEVATDRLLTLNIKHSRIVLETILGEDRLFNYDKNVLEEDTFAFSITKSTKIGTFILTGENNPKNRLEFNKQTSAFMESCEDKAIAEMKLPKDLKESQLLRKLLKEEGYEGVVIGEYDHSSSSPKKFIIDNLNHLKKSGVRTLFMEHLLYDTMQADLDQYYEDVQNKKTKDMPQFIKCYLQKQDRGQRVSDEENGFYALVKAAVEAGIRVVAIDSSVSYSEKTNRIPALNYLSQKIINHEKGEGKWIAFVGGAHLTNYDSTMGIANIMGQPSVMVINGDQDEVSVEANKTLILEKGCIKSSLNHKDGDKLYCNVLVTFPYRNHLSDSDLL